jgi:hypothetical protein
LHNRLRKNLASWSDEYCSIVKKKKKTSKKNHFLTHSKSPISKIVETNALELGYGGILK